MTEWRTVQLSEVADEVTVGHVGPMAQEYRPTGVPFLRSQNVVPFRIDLTDVKFVSREFHARLGKSALHPGDVVTVRTGKPGTTAVIPAGWSDANCADLVITRPGAGLDPHWFSYYMNTSANYVSNYAVGAVQQHFNVGTMKSMTMSLPPVDEQRAIAEVLGALDDKIAANARVAEGADSWIRASYSRVANRACESITFGRLASNVREGVNPSSIDPQDSYVGLGHLPRRLMWLNDRGLGSEVNSLKSRFQSNDILFGKLRPYFHKVVAAPDSGVCSTDILVLRAIDPTLAGWLLAVASSDQVVVDASAHSGGTRMPRTSWKDLAAQEVAWPGLLEARIWSERFESIRDAVSPLLLESRTLASLRDTLLPALMSGKLRVRDAGRQVEEVV